MDLDDLRKHLDDVDRRIVEALSERQRLVADVARHKADRDDASVRDVQREAALLRRVVEVGRGAGLDGYFVQRVFREILDHSLRAQHQRLSDGGAAPDAPPAVIGFLGSEGTWSHVAASRHFSARDGGFALSGFPAFGPMLQAVEEGLVDFAVLPIENTTAGSINEAYDLLRRSRLSVVGEEIVPIEHCLVALQPIPLSNIRRVFSHPQPLAQCSTFLASLSDCHLESVSDTAASVRRVIDDNDLSQAAIAGEEAARRHGLVVLRRDIANQRENFTRFVVVAREPVTYDVRIPCKTSLVFATRHEQGALLGCLNVLAEFGLNLTKLESRPRPRTPWEYLFYVDFEGNLAATGVAEALRRLSAMTGYFRVLGSYPARNTREALPAEPAPAAPSETAEVPRPSAEELRAELEHKPWRLASRVAHADDTRVAVGRAVFGDAVPVVLAGPGSVRDAEHALACARAVREAGADILVGDPSAGVARHPGTGDAVLEALVSAARAFDLPLAVAVHDAADVAHVADRADVLIVPAGAMQNLALLREIGRMDRPVILTRGPMASLDEWLTAADYVMSQGNQQLVLAEAGIRTFETATRATLDLGSVPALRDRSHLPVLVDPSAACTTWRWMPPLARAARAVGACAISVTVDPDAADPRALPADALADLCARLKAG